MKEEKQNLKKFQTEIIRMNFPQRVLVLNHSFCWNKNVTTADLNRHHPTTVRLKV